MQAAGQFLGILLFFCVVLTSKQIQAMDVASACIHSPAAATPHSTYAVVNVEPHDVLNIRARADISSEIIGSIPAYGVGVQIRKVGEQARTSSWLPIRYKGLTGWVSSSYLAQQVGAMDETVSVRAGRIIWALKQKDMKTLSRFVHPDKGVRFSPYAYVRDDDLIFRGADINDMMQDQTVHNWGYFEGTGQPIALTFYAYFMRFIYDAELSHPQQVGCNTVIGKGNTINNIQSFYPRAMFIEYHLVGKDPQQSGMDWRSLRLVLEEQKGTWYLVGIVNDEWTI